jgi:hypothetical protein
MTRQLPSTHKNIPRSRHVDIFHFVRESLKVAYISKTYRHAELGSPLDGVAVCAASQVHMKVIQMK